MKAKILIAATLTLTVLLAGCSKPQAQDSPALAAEDSEKAEMTQMLEAMTPEERARYVQENPEAVQSAYRGVKEENQ